MSPGEACIQLGTNSPFLNAPGHREQHPVHGSGSPVPLLPPVGAQPGYLDFLGFFTVWQ